MHHVTLGAGAPCLMVHCSLARLESLLPLAQAIGGQATLFDLPGHGRSPDWDRTTPYQAQSVAWAAACCEARAHVIGHSFGATVALRLAVERPDLVSCLTLIEPVYFAAARGTPEHDAHVQDFMPFFAALDKGDTSAAAAHFNAQWGGQPWEHMPPRVQASLAERIHLVAAGGPEIEDDPAGITKAVVDIPVTLIRGENSPAVMAAIHAGLLRNLPQGRDHVVAGAGHMLPLTHVDQVAATIRAAGSETG
jgi:lipase